jgi:hypothetical protein
MEINKKRNLINSILLVAGITIVLFLLSLLAKNSSFFVFWGDSAREAAANTANANIRNTDNFNWTFIFIFTVVVYMYFKEIKNKNYKGIAAALALYGVHWLYEIGNAVIQSASGFALWTVSAESTSFMLLIGVSWELSMMFAVAGLVMSKLLPDDRNMKILGMNNRIFFAIINAAFFSVFEIFLAGTPAFIWTYSWWGTIPVFITTYIPFFLASFLIYDAKDKVKKTFLISVWSVVLLLLIILIPLGVI